MEWIKEFSLEVIVATLGSLVASILLGWLLWHNRATITSWKPNDMSTGALFGWIIVFVLIGADILSAFTDFQYIGGTLFAFGIILFFLSDTIHRN